MEVIASPPPFRLSAATGLDRGDRAYQQDQVGIFAHQRTPGCVLAIVADGIGGKSGGRKAADQVLLTGRQNFDRFIPTKDNAPASLKQMLLEAHLMIKLTAIAAEEEPHSTIAAFLILPTLACDVVHAGDSRVYHFRNGQVLRRTLDHSFVQRLIDEGKLTSEAANSHPQANLLTGCLGSLQDPPMAPWHIDRLEIGDSMLACSDGLWHHCRETEIGSLLNSLPPRRAAEALIDMARQRARGNGDNVSLAVVRVEALT